MQDDELSEGDFVAVFNVVAAFEGDFKGLLGFWMDVLDDEVGPQVGDFFCAGVAEFFGREDFFDVVFEVDGEGFGFAVLAASFDGFFEVDAGSCSLRRRLGGGGGGGVWAEEFGDAAAEFGFDTEGDVAAEAEAEGFGSFVGAFALVGVEGDSEGFMFFHFFL